MPKTYTLEDVYGTKVAAPQPAAAPAKTTYTLEDVYGQAQPAVQPVQQVASPLRFNLQLKVMRQITRKRKYPLPSRQVLEDGGIVPSNLPTAPQRNS